jgi:hypothetical protein
MGWMRAAAQKLRTIWTRLKACSFYVSCIVFFPAQVWERGPPPPSRPDVRRRARGVRPAAPSRCEAESSRHAAMGWMQPAAQKFWTIWTRLKACSFYVSFFFLYIRRVVCAAQAGPTLIDRSGKYRSCK